MKSTSGLNTCAVISNAIISLSHVQFKTLSGHSSCYVNVCVSLYVCL